MHSTADAMADLGFRCPKTDLEIKARAKLLTGDPKITAFGSMRLRVSYCMGCGGQHVLTVSDTVSLELSANEIKLVVSHCADSAHGLGQRPIPGGSRRSVRRNGEATVLTTGPRH